MTPPDVQLGMYRHFKGGLYRLEQLARHSESQEWLAVYRALDGDGGLWVRPLAMFFETVTRDGHTTPRFVFVPD